MDNIFLERLKDNKNIFTKEEMNIIKNNINTFKKVYFIGVNDGYITLNKN